MLSRALYINMVGMVLLISCACLCGVALFAVYGRCDPLKLGLIERSDQLMPFFVMRQLSQYPGVPGLFVACVFSASLSTLSSGYNALSTVTWDDFLRHTSLANMSERRVKLVCKLIGASYGLLSILTAFFVGLVGNVLQAAISLAGALFGPLFGLYILALLCPLANSIGVLTGLFVGQSFTIWILIGSLMFPKATPQYPTSIDDCSRLLLGSASYDPLPHLMESRSANATAAHLAVDGNEASFVMSLYHMAFLLVPISGFVLSLIVGFTVSLLTGGTRNITRTAPEHLSAITWCVWPSACVPRKEASDRSFDELPVTLSDRVRSDHSGHLSSRV